METVIHMSQDDLKQAIGMWVAKNVNYPYETELIHIRVSKGGEYDEPEYGALVKLQVHYRE